MNLVKKKKISIGLTFPPPSPATLSPISLPPSAVAVGGVAGATSRAAAAGHPTLSVVFVISVPSLNFVAVNQTWNHGDGVADLEVDHRHLGSWMSRYCWSHGCISASLLTAMDEPVWPNFEGKFVQIWKLAAMDGHDRKEESEIRDIVIVAFKEREHLIFPQKLVVGFT